MIETTCPYCYTVLPTLPQRKTKCRSCGRSIFVKRAPGEKVKRLVTENEAELIERLWKIDAVEKLASREAQWLQLDAGSLVKYARDTDETRDLHQGIREQLCQRAKSGEKTALLGMIAHTFNPAESRYWKLALVEAELQALRSKRVASVQLSTGTGGACDVCDALNGKVVSSESTAEQVIPRNCPRLDRPGVHCHVVVSAWIKREDGTGYVDYLPAQGEPIRNVAAPINQEVAEGPGMVERMTWMQRLANWLRW